MNAIECNHFPKENSRRPFWFLRAENLSDALRTAESASADGWASKPCRAAYNPETKGEDGDMAFSGTYNFAEALSFLRDPDSVDVFRRRGDLMMESHSRCMTLPLSPRGGLKDPRGIFSATARNHPARLQRTERNAPPPQKQEKHNQRACKYFKCLATQLARILTRASPGIPQPSPRSTRRVCPPNCGQPRRRTELTKSVRIFLQWFE